LPGWATALVITVLGLGAPSNAASEETSAAQSRLLAIQWGKGPDAWDEVIAVNPVTYVTTLLYSYYVEGGGTTGLAVDEATDRIYVKYHYDDGGGTFSKLVTLDPDGAEIHIEDLDPCKLMVHDANQSRLLAIRGEGGPEAWDEVIAIDPITYATTVLYSYYVEGGGTTGLAVDNSTGLIYVKYHYDDGGTAYSKLATLNPDGTAYDVVDFDLCKMLVYDAGQNRLLAIRWEDGPYASDELIAIDPVTYATDVLYTYYVDGGGSTGLAHDDGTGQIYVKYHYDDGGDLFSKLVKLSSDGAVNDVEDVDPNKMLVFNWRDEVAYCVAHGSCGKYISHVQIGGIDNLSGCIDGYSDYTHLSTEVEIGIAHDVTVTNGGPHKDDLCGIWVDWNQDSDFYDDDEAIWVSGTPGPGPYTALIIPPYDAKLGETTMRVRIGGLDPCGDTPCGEVEDYTLEVTGQCAVWNSRQQQTYGSIQAAIDSAVDGDELVATPCTYYETIDFLGKAITLRSSEGAEATVIDASGWGETAVKCVNGEGPDTVLEGFTVTGGSPLFANGGGMRNLNSSPSVAGCAFRGNTAFLGGGMYNEFSSPTVTNCTFSDNVATFAGAAGGGGGMYNDNSSPTVSDCTFSRNSATGAQFPVGVGGGMCNSENSSPTVSNCTFSDNLVDGQGGGMHNFNNSNPIVANCTFSGNVANDWGGGMTNISNCNPAVNNCIFSRNSTAVRAGGGMRNLDSSPIVTNCIFSGNYADSDGGGMYNVSGSPTVANCTFTGNYAEADGGGMYNGNSNVIVFGCAFSGNHAEYDGGGMYSQYGSLTVTNCTFSGNSAGYGGGMRIRDVSATLVNCLFWGNIPSEIRNGQYLNIRGGGMATISYCDIGGCGGSGKGWDSSLGLDGGGNIDADPLFVRNPDLGPDGQWGTDDDDYGDLHVQGGSPCIDAADNTAVPPELSTDLDGNPRFADDLCTDDTGSGVALIVDMGGYEFQGTSCDLDSDGRVGIADLLTLLANWGPCPDCDNCPADFDGDCVVGISDLLTLLANWG
jgi:parallel beta-helix repeat protein